MNATFHPPPRNLRTLEWLNFFLADVQTGLGPFLAAYLAATGWNPGRVGFALTGIALLAFVLLWFAVPETVNKDGQVPKEETPLIPRKELFAE